MEQQLKKLKEANVQLEGEWEQTLISWMFNIEVMFLNICSGIAGITQQWHVSGDIKWSSKLHCFDVVIFMVLVCHTQSNDKTKLEIARRDSMIKRLIKQSRHMSCYKAPHYCVYVGWLLQIRTRQVRGRNCRRIFWIRKAPWRILKRKKLAVLFQARIVSALQEYHHQGMNIKYVWTNSIVVTGGIWYFLV